MEQRFAPIFVNLKSNTFENHDAKVAIVNQFSKLNNKKFFIKIKKKRVCQNDAPSYYISQSPYFHKLGL